MMIFKQSSGIASCIPVISQLWISAMALSDAFESCAVEPVTEGKDGKATHIVVASAGGWKTTSFFIDSSGHSTFDLPLNLSFDSKEKMDEFLKSKCLNPAPKNLVEDDESANAKNDGSSSVVASLGFEIKSFSVDESKNVVVECVNVEECLIEDTTLQFVLKVTVRASNHQIESLNNKHGGDSVNQSDLSVVTNLEVVPVLTIKENASEKDSSPIPDPMTLEMAATPQYMRKAKLVSSKELRLSPINLNLCLTNAFTISVKSVDGPTIGNTLISLTIRHSNSHQEKVTISNISMHPGHSRYKTISDKSKNQSGAQYSVTNMTQSVQWGYAPKTQLDLPLTLNPHDAHATILTVDASEEIQGRSFISPVSVTGVIGSSSAADGELGSERKHVVVAADAMWSTGLIAVEPTDAFRVDMNVQSSNVVLGEPMVVSLDIFNLSLEACDLMLLMAKDEGNPEEEETSKHKAVNAAVISEVDGYKFGVWGISGEDDGTVKLIRDNELLAMDAALMLGKVQGQHSVEAKLRFVPLREGRLRVPNWKLYDRAAGTWYTCHHNLTIVASAKAEVGF
ncbi:unnamed protein product [Cylindrotheca closterium]|uniref:Uncharacterized protein n=1 Tax=Cylindrotheca closterium TaxID=2856 RepID=A0AAD2JJ46_9STRA|nr:unnamed protein product [Cylindrotheca closterium]